MNNQDTLRCPIGMNYPNEENNNQLLNSMQDFALQLGFQNARMQIDTKTNTASIMGQRDGLQYTTTIKQFKHGSTKNSTIFEIGVGKEALIEQIKELKAQGYTQVEIARTIGISQSLVSKYLKL